MPSKRPSDAAQGHTGANAGILTLVGDAEALALRLDRPWLTQEALDQARRTVDAWPCLGPSQWSEVADALGLRLRDDRKPVG
jgi:hypothetical protein